MRKGRDQRRRAHAAEFLRREQHPGITRMRRKRRHAAPRPRQRMLVIERAEIVKKLHRAGKRFRFRRLDPGKRFEIVDAARLQRQQRAAQFEPPNFGQRLRRALFLLALGPKPHAVSWRGAARATKPLLRGGPADLFDQQRVDPAMRIEPRHAGESAVDHHAHAVDGQRGLRHVGRDDDLPFLARRNRGVLLRGRQLAVQRMKRKVARAEAVAHRVERALNFVRAGHENQDVALGTLARIEQRARTPPRRVPRPGRRSAWADIRA